MLDPATDPGGILASDQVACPPSESENLPAATQTGNLANPAQITFGCIRDAANYLSLPLAARDFLLQDSKISTSHPPPPVQINTTVISENKLCEICHVYTSKCSCRRQCNICNMWTELGGTCQCDIQNLTALKARFDTDILDESDIVLEDQQTNISEMVDGKFEMFNLAPPTCD